MILESLVIMAVGYVCGVLAMNIAGGGKICRTDLKKQPNRSTLSVP